MRLENEVYEYIKQEVIDLFERYNVNCIPISGFELANKMGIVLIPYSSLSKKQLKSAYEASPDGFYMEPGDGKEYIYYNDDRNYERINMTILHELGHCVLGHNDDTPDDRAEAEANFFAKYAIAPPPLVHRIRPTCPEKIKEIFGLSYEASCYAFNYYNKWLEYGEFDYTDYEMRMLQLFSIAN